MSWQLLVGISVLLFSFNGLFHRVIMRDTKSDPYAQTIAFYGLGGIFLFLLAIFRGGFHYQILGEQLPYFVLLIIFATAAPVLSFKAIQRIEASENSILIASQKLWIVIGAFIFLQESFSVNRLLGMMIILAGITIVQWKKGKFVLNKGVVFALLAAFSYAITELISFYILRDFNAISFTIYLSFLPVIALLIIKPGLIRKLSFYLKPKYALNIAAVSISDAVATIFLFLAYQIGRNAAQIAPIMATQTILSVLFAIFILKERNNMINKIVGALIVVVGVILVL